MQGKTIWNSFAAGHISLLYPQFIVFCILNSKFSFGKTIHPLVFSRFERKMQKVTIIIISARLHLLAIVIDDGVSHD